MEKWEPWMADRDTFIRLFRMKMLAILSLRYGVMYITVGGIFWGLAVLVFRVTLRVERARLFWPVLALVPVVAVACIHGRRRLPSLRQVKALFDSHNGCGGMLMAADEIRLRGWSEAANLTAPKIHWKFHRRLGCLAVVAMFVGLCFFAPTRPLAAGAAGAMNIDHDVDRIAKKIETLEELEILEEETTTALQEMLKNVQEDAAGNDPVKTFEALDHLEQLTAGAARKEAESALGGVEKMTKAQSLAGALRQGVGSLQQPRREEAISELAQTLRETMRENQTLCEALSPDIAEATREGKFSPGQLGELAEVLKKCKACDREMLQKLCDARLIDPETLRLCERLGRCCDARALVEMLGEPCDAISVAEACAQCNACRGGVTRGRGDAEMTWTSGSDPDGSKFRELLLSPGAMPRLDESRTVGVSKGTPQIDAQGGPSVSGALRGAPAGGGSAITHTVPPRHRAAVKRYFQRDK